MNWVEIKALNRLYNNKEIKLNKTISNSPVFKTHEQAGEITKRRKTYVAEDDFIQVYETKYLNDFEKYYEFLGAKELLKPQLKFSKKAIDLLISFDEGLKNGKLTKLREDLIKAQESVKGFSLMFFKNEKYLDHHSSLVDAIKKILDIELVDNKSQQYLYVLQCYNPKLIILCENGNFLNRDKLPRENNYELWYAGGRNVPKLKYTPEIRRGLPIYYSADWDKDGLEIYQLAKKIIPDLKLLHPDGISRSIITTEHKSHWLQSEHPKLLSGLDANLYSEKDKEKIKELITKNHWITEEGNNLKAMIEHSDFYSPV
ncbi:hypothetical protein Q4Q35_05695 [Flavivirga aquimarina]|uniref:Wadjet protein JetD C-terminal domain-containing protein n=1 Tax=Flavivirga aquimarina TaxID=2027862 RepID=A0ABT8W871_9FLAO|nr:hypothetical protein [Flavivirga aquimarina]MDO5969293.1 hypothetical protein [Flavivirga aquimarina]